MLGHLESRDYVNLCSAMEIAEGFIPCTARPRPLTFNHSYLAEGNAYIVYAIGNFPVLKFEKYIHGSKPYL